MRASLAVLIIVLAAALADAQVRSAGAEPLVIVRNGLYGYVDHNGAVIITPQFLWAGDFENGYGTVYVCGRYALIDKAGRLFPAQTPRGAGELCPKKVGGKIGFVNPDGKLKIKPEFDEVLPFSDGLAAARVNARWGFIDSSGHFAIAPRFDAAFYFREGVGIAQMGSTTLLIDKAGKELARGYEVLSGVTSEGRIPVSRSSKHGYLDLRGAIAIPLAFDGAGTFSEGLAAVQKGTKWGYIDKRGSTVIPFQFDDAGEFGAGLAPVKVGDATGFIDHSGAFAFRLAFEYAPGFRVGDQVSDVSRFWTKSRDFGYVNTSGRVIWGPVPGSPSHTPILGWTTEEKKASCDVVPESVRQAAAALPLGDD